MVKMVTGEDVAIGKTIATQLGLGSNIVAASDIFTGDVGQTEVPRWPDNGGRSERPPFRLDTSDDKRVERHAVD